MTKRFFSLMLAFFCLIGCAGIGHKYAARAATRPIMDRYIEIMRQPESTTKWVQTDTLLQELEDELMVKPARRGLAIGIITDDKDRPLNGVEITVRWHNPESLANWRGDSAASKTIVVSGSFNVAMEGYPRLSIKFRKAGFADAGWFIEKGRSYESMQATRRRLDGGDRSYVVPRSDGGPGVQVVMYPAHFEWDPAGNRDFFLPDEKYWPKTAPANAPILIRSDVPQIIAVPETGTYIATDAQGNVLDVVRLRRGMQLGFDPPMGAASYVWTGSRIRVAKDQKGPYFWRLYSIAKPIYPATQPATKE